MIAEITRRWALYPALGARRSALGARKV